MTADPDDPSIQARFRKIGVMPKRVDRLGEAGTFVVRPAELARFVSSLEGNREAPGASAETRRRRTLLTIIAALCKRAGIDPAARGAAISIASATQELGVPVSDDSIREMLKAIPDAIESRAP